MATQGFRLIVFDCDGTLVDSQHGIVSCMTAACLGLGLAAPDAAAVRKVIGPSLEQAIEMLFPAYDAAALAGITAKYREAAVALRGRADYTEPLFDGIRDVIDAFARTGSLLGIATGRNHRGLIHTLGVHGLGERFATLQTPDTCRSKPDPDMLHKAMAETGVYPEETVIVGDTSYDMLMGRNARTAAVGVGWGYHGVAELRDAGALAIADSAASLPEVLRSLQRIG